MPKLKILRLDKSLPLPKKTSEGSSGFDIYSSIDYSLKPFESKGIPTGISVSIQKGYEIEIRPRSGLALKYGIGILNSPGTIDSDYRGEIIVILFNFSHNIFNIKKGDRIAQMIVSKLPLVRIEEVKKLSKTKRGKKGFGSSGIS